MYSSYSKYYITFDSVYIFTNSCRDLLRFSLCVYTTCSGLFKLVYIMVRRFDFISVHVHNTHFWDRLVLTTKAIGVASLVAVYHFVKIACAVSIASLAVSSLACKILPSIAFYIKIFLLDGTLLMDLFSWNLNNLGKPIGFILGF